MRLSRPAFIVAASPANLYAVYNLFTSYAIVSLKNESHTFDYLSFFYNVSICLSNIIAYYVYLMIIIAFPVEMDRVNIGDKVDFSHSKRV